MAASTDLATIYVRWKAVHATFHRGYWLVASLYLVLDAELSAFQLVFIGTAQGVVSVIGEIPAGVIADTMGRKRSLVIAHLLMGSGIAITGLVTEFPLLIATQMLWGLSWTFISGADVAWITDELDDPRRIESVLAASARWQAMGSIVGLVLFGGLAWGMDRGDAIVVSGLATIVLGIHVALSFPERNFDPVQARRWRAGVETLRCGFRLARRDRVILLLVSATFFVNGAAEIFGRLYAKQLVALGFPSSPDPIVWYTALGIAVLLVGIAAVRTIEHRINGVGTARRSFGIACLIGVIGIGLLAAAPDPVTASTGIVLVSGVSLSLTRVVGSIWLNRQVPSSVRATVHSFLAQAEYLGEIACGFPLAIAAGVAGVPAALFGGAAILLLTGITVLRSSHDRAVVP